MEHTTRGEQPHIAVRVDGLHKRYGAVRAVDGLTFEAHRGEVFGLLGPNGAGKTTTIEILQGELHRNAGTVSVLGFDPAHGQRAYRQRIGVVPQSGGIDLNFRLHEVIEIYSAAYPHPMDSDDVIEIVGLEQKRNAKVKELSGGQRRRLDLALGIAGDPDLIFLDEPTTGFDPSARRRSWELIDRLRGLGKTILLTTHYMDEAQHLADRVVVMAAGKVIAEGTPDSLAGREDATATVRFRLPAKYAAADLPLPKGAEIERGEGDENDSGGDRITFQTATPTLELAPVVAWAAERGLELPGLNIMRPSLEDIYLQLTDANDDAEGDARRGASTHADHGEARDDQ